MLTTLFALWLFFLCCWLNFYSDEHFYFVIPMVRLMLLALPNQLSGPTIDAMRKLISSGLVVVHMLKLQADAAAGGAPLFMTSYKAIVKFAQHVCNTCEFLENSKCQNICE